MDGRSGGRAGLLKRLRGKGRTAAPRGRGQMKMLRRLPRLLRFIPGTAQDVRAYFLTLQYWLAGSERMSPTWSACWSTATPTGRAPALRGRSRRRRRSSIPEVGVYHPRAAGPHRRARRAAAAASGSRGTVGLLLMRSYVLAGNAAHYDGVIAALEARGPARQSRPSPAGSTRGRRSRDISWTTVRRRWTRWSRSPASVWSAARPTTTPTPPRTMLAELDVPYIAAHPVEFQTLEQWQADPRGLLPVEATMMVAIPELDGAICPMTFGGRSRDAGDDSGATWSRTASGRRCWRRASPSWWRCAAGRAPSARSRMVLFNFPPNAGATGTAAYLSVFASLLNTLSALAAAGYTVDVPATVEALRDARSWTATRARYGTDANVAARIPADDHVRRERWLDEIETQWGPAPGPAPDRRRVACSSSAQQFGNVFVGVQPAFGYEGDPMRLLFERGFAPTHAFSRLLSLDRARISAPMRCCISARMAHWSSCRASRPDCRASAGPTG